MELFGRPLLDEGHGIETLSERRDSRLNFMSDAIVLCPTNARILTLVNEAIHQSCAIYVYRATSPDHAPAASQMLDELQALMTLAPANAPGAHALVWTSFVGAAESASREHRKFFVDYLVSIYIPTGFGNIIKALDNLKEIWKMQGKVRWTLLVQKLPTVFIM